uniref:Uncharacterized protein n=1 Tax=Anguilla anguilla TaxID=7936 RepID=A0A0E9USK0_ANGAN
MFLGGFWAWTNRIYTYCPRGCDCLPPPIINQKILISSFQTLKVSNRRPGCVIGRGITCTL